MPRLTQWSWVFFWPTRSPITPFQPSCWSFRGAKDKHHSSPLDLVISWDTLAVEKSLHTAHSDLDAACHPPPPPLAPASRTLFIFCILLDLGRAEGTVLGAVRMAAGRATEKVKACRRLLLARGALSTWPSRSSTRRRSRKRRRNPDCKRPCE